MGSEIWRACPVTGSGLVVSPEAMNTHPRESIEFVKKSPRRRSCPVAAHVVPPWQTPLSWIGRPAASTVVTAGLSVSAACTVADLMLILAELQSRSTSLSLSYQTMLMFPASPATIHGQKARRSAGGPTVLGLGPGPPIRCGQP